MMLLRLCEKILNPHLFVYGEKERKIKVLNIEKNLKLLEKKLEEKSKKMTIYKI